MKYTNTLLPRQMLRTCALAVVCTYAAATALADNVDVLVVGGGGGGGNANNSTSGGGGGGSVQYVSNMPLTINTSYPVTIGAGGGPGAAGANSSFNSTVAYGGGRGGGTGGAPTSGGSGGGGITNGAGAAAGSGASVNAGGHGDNGGSGWKAGGGGGAGAVGGGLYTGGGFNGGAGIANSITGTSTYYGGGGGGGGMNSGSPTTGGLGGGGGSPTGQTGANGVANTGGGGGGGGADNNSGIPYNGGAGGSGVVIIRYTGAPRATGGTITTAGGYAVHTFTSNGTFVLGPPPPAITSPGTASGMTGQAISSYTITATNTPTGFSASGLPAGLTLNTTTGVISGTPTSAGSFNSTITASNGAGPGSATLAWTISSGAPTVTSTTTASATQGQSASYTITATNTPTSFSASGLPAGLTLNTTTGVIAGTPTSAGSFNSTITATNGAGSGSVTLAWTIASGAPTVTSATTASATQGQSASYTITATNTPTSFSATGLPAGVALNTSTGAIAGTPTVSGTFNTSITAANSHGTSAAVTLVWTIAGPIVLVTPSNTGTAVVHGNMGVGTSTPKAKLDIQVPNAANVSDGLVVERADGATLLGLKLRSDATGHFRGALTVKPNGGTEIEALTVLADQSTGNVGIGTSTPGSRLSVQGGSTTAVEIQAGVGGDVLSLRNSTGGLLAAFKADGKIGLGTASPSFPLSLGSSVGNKLALYDAGGGSGYGFGIQDNVLQIYAHLATDRVGIGHGNSDSFTETLTVKGGNVGIGTLSPSHKLAVNGTIRAKEVIVNTGWADYVFADDYDLAPLAEVETHIKAHRHLPGIPSAAEVEQRGVSLGEMQARLLAKIEELTLHQIAQEKQLNAQAARLTQLEKENAALRQP